MELDTGLFQHSEYLGQSLVGRHAVALSNRFNVAGAIPAALAKSGYVQSSKAWAARHLYRPVQPTLNQRYDATEREQTRLNVLLIVNVLRVFR